MASVKIPNPMERRHLIEADLPPDKALAIADVYQAGGRDLESVAFLLQAGARDRLEALMTQAVDGGDAFLLRQVAQSLQIEASKEQWLALGEAADRAGLDRYVETARRYSNRDLD